MGAVFAAAIGLFAYSYLTQPRTPSSAAVPRTVVIASRPIPARTQIDPTMLETQTRPADQVEPGTFESTLALTGDVSMTDISAGAALTASNAGRPSQLAGPVHLQRGMRAVSIAIDEIKGVSGLLQPGDKVDVYAITQRQNGAQSEVYGILRDVPVLAVAGSTSGVIAGPSGPPAQLERSVTLEVTPQQAKTLVLADLNANLRLALRPPDEPMRSVSTDRFTLAPQENNPPPVAAQAPLPAPPPAQPTENPDAVQYILGDKVTTTPKP